jgi:hypothetical protein
MKPREYQTEISDKAAHLLRTRRIAYLAMEVRTGKTLTAFWTLQKVGATRCLFVTKKKAIKSIEKDADSVGFDAVVINYEQAHKVTERFDFIVIDEAHCVGAFPKPAGRFKDLRKLIDQNTKLILLSGTPSPESYSQLYHQFALHPCGPFSEWPTFYAWARRFVTVKPKYVGQGMPINDYSNARYNEFSMLVKPLMLTYTQQQAGFTQEIIEYVHTVEMNAHTYQIAKAILNDGVHRGNTDMVLADSGVKVQSKLHQIYSGTVIGEEKAHIFDRTKAVYIRDTFKGSKIAVFTKFQAEAEMMAGVFLEITSSPEEFNASPHAVFVGQIQSSREGVNLSTADCLIYLTPDFSALSYLQGRDRASYMGRTTPPEVHWIFAKGGIEAEIYERVRNKEDYTLKHFKHDRGKLSIEAEKAIAGAGVARHQNSNGGGVRVS